MVTPLELASVYRELRALNWSNDDIARRMGRKRAHVDQILALAELRFDIQKGYRPTLDQIDHLLGLLARPQEEDPGKAQSEGSKPADQ